MDTVDPLYANLLLLGAAHGGFLALAIIGVGTGNQVALRLLGLLTVSFAVDLGINYLNVSGFLREYPRLFFVESVVVFLYGPLLYLYVLELTDSRSLSLSVSSALHFVPFALSLALLVPLLRLPNENLVQMIYQGAPVEPEFGFASLAKWSLDVLPRLLIGAYVVFAYRVLLMHGRRIRAHFSEIEQISLNWLRNLVIAVGLLWMLYLVALASGGRGWVENVLNVAIVLVFYALGYMGLRQPAVFIQPDEAPDSVVDSHAPMKAVADDATKYQRSALDAATGESLLLELKALMETERPYLDPKLTLTQLAEKLGLSSNYLSQIINQQTGGNFFDYINGHRVQAAKEILADPTQARKNVLTVAMDAGFNSKSAFYAAFRQHASTTPVQYRRSVLS